MYSHIHARPHMHTHTLQHAQSHPEMEGESSVPDGGDGMEALRGSSPGNPPGLLSGA